MSANSRKALRIGAIVLLISLAILFVPLVLHLGQNAKYVVAPALIGLLLGAGVILNSVIDLLRGE